MIGDFGINSSSITFVKVVWPAANRRPPSAYSFFPCVSVRVRHVMIVEIAFAPVSAKLGMEVAAGGGVSLMTWYFLMGRSLFQFGCL